MFQTLAALILLSSCISLSRDMYSDNRNSVYFWLDLVEGCNNLVYRNELDLRLKLMFSTDFKAVPNKQLLI